MRSEVFALILLNAHRHQWGMSIGWTNHERPDQVVWCSTLNLQAPV